MILPCVWICSCATYDNTPSGGRFLGEARMVPVTPNNFFFYRPQDRDDVLFSYVPSPQGRFANRFEGNKITPDAMLTTGASVPRSLWGYSGLSPFDYTRAALIHDWLFEAHHRYEVGKWLSQHGGDEAKKRKGERLMQEYRQFASLTQDEASDIYAECIRALMEESERMRGDLDAKIKRDNNPMTAERLKDLRDSLKDSRPSKFRIWAHHWTTSTRCIVPTGKKMWMAQHDDLGVYEALAGSDYGVEKGYMSKWLQKKFRNVYEEREGTAGSSTSKMAGVSHSVDTTLNQLATQARAGTLPARVYLEVGDAASQEVLRSHARDFAGIELKMDKDFSGVSPDDLRVYYYKAEDRAEAERVLATVLAMLPQGYRPQGGQGDPAE